ncbi:MAG: transketolase C-terminal domain-containing protein [Cyanobium sp. MAG06]|nr:transketolase C-terminal domain-containing protein [Cyanobium sp. MAG06]
MGTGPVLYEAIKSALKYKNNNKVQINIFNLNIIKENKDNNKNIVKDIVKFANNQNHIITVEEHQINAGIGGMIAEILSENLPKRVYRIGIKDRFGQSGTIKELYKEYNIDEEYITNIIENLIIHKY